MSESNQYLHKLVVKNTLGIELITIDVEGRHLLVTGANGTGKSSIINAILLALGGKDSKRFPDPIRHGAEKAVINADLSDYSVRRVITEKGMDLLVRSRKTGAKYDSPQLLLNSFLGDVTINPGRLISASPAERVRLIQQKLGLAPPVARVTEILGEEVPARPGESASEYIDRLAGNDGILYVRRTELGRVVRQKQASLEESEREVAALGSTQVVVSIADLVAQRQAVQEHQDRRVEAAAAVRSANAECQRTDAEMSGLLRDLDAVRIRISKLRRELADAEAQETKLAGDEVLGRDCVVADRAAVIAAVARLERIPDRSADLRRLDESIREAEGMNAALAQRDSLIAIRDRLDREAKEAIEAHEKADCVLAQIRQVGRNVFDGFDLGESGLFIENGDVCVKHPKEGLVPFGQVNLARQLAISFSVCARENPHTRLALIDNGEHFDAQGREAFRLAADRLGYQVVMAAVADGPLELHFHERTVVESAAAV